MYEIPKNIKLIVTKPRIKKYIEYYAKIYSIYLKMYNKSLIDLSKTIIKDILNKTVITAACGIETNLYLSKIALDITTKHSCANIVYLIEEKYKKEL